MKKVMSFLLALVVILGVTAPVYAAGIEEDYAEIELTLDADGNARVAYGYAVYEDGIIYYDLSNAADNAVFEAIQNDSHNRAAAPKAIGSFHVGIEMVSETQYKMYYEVHGVGLLVVGGYMKCKSTALLFATTYHDERFSQTSIGTTMMSGESAVFSLPSGTEKVKVGWHDITVKDGNGYAELSDAYATVKVG